MSNQSTPKQRKQKVQPEAPKDEKIEKLQKLLAEQNLDIDDLVKFIEKGGKKKLMAVGEDASKATSGEAKVEKTKPSKSVKKVDLLAIAVKELMERGFLPDFDAKVKEEVAGFKGPADIKEAKKDLRNLQFFSVDNDDSKDIDQISCVQKDPKGYRVYVGIADVTCLVKKDDPIDQHAKNNTTSVYTPIKNFLMIPDELSTGFTSLNGKEDRLSMIVDMLISNQGELLTYQVYQAAVHNFAQLAYNSVSDWIEGKGPFPAKGEGIPGLQEHIRLHDEVAQIIKAQRLKQGSLVFQTNALKVVMENKIPVRVEKVGKNNRAQEIIENLMIMANQATTKFLLENKFPVIRRVVKTPERWDRIVKLAKEMDFDLPETPDANKLQKFLILQQQKAPENFADLSISVIKLMGRGEYITEYPDVGGVEGHFALAIQNYSHTTAPNRRFSDVVTQRLLKAVLTKQTNPYTNEELEEIAKNCTEKEKEADKVERRVLKSAIAIVYSKRVGEEFDAIVVGNNPEKGKFVRLCDPPIEGKLIKAVQKELDVGTKIRVRLASVNMAQGWVDFSEVPTLESLAKQQKQKQQEENKGSNSASKPKSQEKKGNKGSHSQKKGENQQSEKKKKHSKPLQSDFRN